LLCPRQPRAGFSNRAAVRYHAWGSAQKVMHDSSSPRRESAPLRNPDAHEMKGKLYEQPLAELIREIGSEKLSGSLRLEQDRIKAAIYFDRGTLVYATSNLRPHRLAEALRRWRVITDAQFSALTQDGKSDADAARALLEQGVLNKEALDELRARLVADVLRPALLWTEGSWSFDPRVRLAEDVRVQIELPELLMEAARRFPRKLAARRFTVRNEKLQPATAALNSLSLLQMEGLVLSRIDVPLRLNELVAISGLSEEETLHACYALALGGFIEREAWPRAFSHEEIAKLQAAAAQSATLAPTAAAVEPKQKTEKEEAKPVAPEVDERRELEELFERVARATSHYQVLGVSRTIEPDALKQTYHKLARRFHPDRFHQDAEIHRRVEDVFARIAQAYEALRDKSARAAYDLKLDREKDVRPTTRAGAQSEEQSAGQATASRAAQPPSATGRERNAEESFQRGLSALKTGNAALALASFAEAARLEPKVARYRAQYGQALSEQEPMRHRAEAEIQAALVIEPGNVSYRIMLAKLYRNLGFIKRAQGEIERARSIDPRNPEVQTLLAELQSMQGAR
jgi:curved DNA-binding protein CbpA